jgi:hypothetical protein
MATGGYDSTVLYARQHDIGRHGEAVPPKHLVQGANRHTALDRDQPPRCVDRTDAVKPARHDQVVVGHAQGPIV